MSATRILTAGAADAGEKPGGLRDREVLPHRRHARGPDRCRGHQRGRGDLPRTPQHAGPGVHEDREERRHLTRDIYVPPPNEPGLGRLEAALDKVLGALAVEALDVFDPKEYR